MRLKYTVDVTVDPAEIESGIPADVVRDEIQSNLESVGYVKSCQVTPVMHSDRHRQPPARSRAR